MFYQRRKFPYLWVVMCGQVGFHQACHTPYHHLLLSLVYTVFLIVVVAVLAVKSRGIRDNYREATFIGLAVACVIPVWLGWALCGLVCFILLFILITALVNRIYCNKVVLKSLIVYKGRCTVIIIMIKIYILLILRP